MLKRKIDNRIKELAGTGKILILSGARQVGKTYAALQYANDNYEHVIVVSFAEHPELIAAFASSISGEEILLKLSVLYGDDMIPGETIIIFDDIQECPGILDHAAELAEDDRYVYILIGVVTDHLIREKIIASGITKLKMYPLDLEEFCLSLGVGEDDISSLRSFYESTSQMWPKMHENFSSIYRRYLVVGGMPAAVNEYLESRNLSRVRKVQEDIFTCYRSAVENVGDIRMTELYNGIPAELDSTNKRFILSDVYKYAKIDFYREGLERLCLSGTAIKVLQADEKGLSMPAPRSEGLFKLYLNDTGLLTAAYGGDSQFRILNGDTAIGHGAIVENFVAQELTVHGVEPYYCYFRGKGEVDFLFTSGGGTVPIEVRSGKDYKRIRAVRSLVAGGVCRDGILLHDGNIDTAGELLCLPIYMTMFLKENDYV